MPRYQADHAGEPRDLTPAELAKWAELRSRAEVSFDFDWQDPGQIAAQLPAAALGAGHKRRASAACSTRTGLADSKLVFTTAAGVHGVPLAEFAMLGLLYFAKDVPRLRRLQRGQPVGAASHQAAGGSRVVLVGLGGIGREVARLLAAAGIEVTGAGRRAGPTRCPASPATWPTPTSMPRCPAPMRWSWPAR